MSSGGIGGAEDGRGVGGPDAMRHELDQVIREALRTAGTVVDPCSLSADVSMTIAEMGLLKAVEIVGETAIVKMRLTAPGCPMVPYFQASLEERLVGLGPIRQLRVETDGGMEWTPRLMTADARRRQARRNTLRAARRPSRRTCDE